MAGLTALKRFLMKAGHAAKSGGEMGLGAASLGVKGAAKAANKNPKTAAALAGAAAGAGVTAATNDESPALERYRKKKRLSDD